MHSHLLSQFTAGRPLILASESLQRKRILEMMEIPFRVVKSEFEEIIDTHLSPQKNAAALAEGKAADVFQKFPDALVVGVDTLVVSGDGEILGKPKDQADAQRMIAQKSGQKELVISGICLISARGKIVRHETTELYFTAFTNDDVEKILGFNEWEGVSGAIRVEGKASLFIEKIHGNFWNIVGFPVLTFMEMLGSE